MTYKILQIDGGGIRGIIPSVICAAIEERKGEPISRLFDMISGTSTGAILGGALAAGIPQPGCGTSTWRKDPRCSTRVFS